MPLGEESGEGAGAAADLAKLGAWCGEQVGNLTLLRQAARHQCPTEAAHGASGQNERVANSAGRAARLQRGVVAGHVVAGLEPSSGTPAAHSRQVSD